MRSYKTALSDGSKAIDLNDAATWFYRWLMLGMLAGVTLSEFGAPQETAAEILALLFYAGAFLAAFKIVAPPLIALAVFALSERGWVDYDRLIHG